MKNKNKQKSKSQKLIIIKRDASDKTHNKLHELLGKGWKISEITANSSNDWAVLLELNEPEVPEHVRWLRALVEKEKIQALAEKEKSNYSQPNKKSGISFWKRGVVPKMG